MTAIALAVSLALSSHALHADPPPAASDAVPASVSTFITQFDAAVRAHDVRAVGAMITLPLSIAYLQPGMDIHLRRVTVRRIDQLQRHLEKLRIPAVFVLAMRSGHCRTAEPQCADGDSEAIDRRDAELDERTPDGATRDRSEDSAPLAAWFARGQPAVATQPDGTIIVRFVRISCGAEGHVARLHLANVGGQLRLQRFEVEYN